MNRRDLIKSLIGFGVAATFDLEKALWVPGEKTIFIPPLHIPTLWLDTFEYGTGTWTLRKVTLEEFRKEYPDAKVVPEPGMILHFASGLVALATTNRWVNKNVPPSRS